MNTEQERAAFEAWYRLHHGSLNVYGRDASGEYADKQVQGAFNVWLARAAMIDLVDDVRAALTAQPVTHPDDAAVDRFAAAMKAKLSKKRAEGRSGWDDKAQCTGEFLSALLREHVDKGDPLDVGNLAMMLHQRGERISAQPAASADPREVDMTEYQAMVAAMEQIDPATLPGLTAAQRCALGLFAKPAGRPAWQAQPVAWVAADTLHSPHPTCVSSLAYMSQLDKDRCREYVPLYTAQQPAEQQPAPDVARLVEVLECARKDLSDWITSFPEAAHAHTTIVIARIDAALAAYRKQGGGA